MLPQEEITCMLLLTYCLTFYLFETEVFKYCFRETMHIFDGPLTYESSLSLFPNSKATPQSDIIFLLPKEHAYFLSECLLADILFNFRVTVFILLLISERHFSW